MMKRTRRMLRWISVVLVFVLLVPVLPVSAAEPPVTYSDLFYGYSTDYLLSGSLHRYAISTGDALVAAADAYMGSPDFAWTSIVTGLSAATHPRELIQILSDSCVLWHSPMLLSFSQNTR